jgi:hypothetical protein
MIEMDDRKPPPKMTPLERRPLLAHVTPLDVSLPPGIDEILVQKPAAVTLSNDPPRKRPPIMNRKITGAINRKGKPGEVLDLSFTSDDSKRDEFRTCTM